MNTYSRTLDLFDSTRKKTPWAKHLKCVKEFSAASWSLTKVPLLAMERGLFTSVMVLVTPPTTVVTTWACWATVTAPDLCTVMMGLVVVGEDPAAVPT